MYEDKKSDQLANITAKPNEALSTNILPWSKLGNVEVVRKWSEEIIAVIKSDGHLEDWALVGHAITLIHEDAINCRNILQKVAHDIGFEFSEINATEIQQRFSAEPMDINYSVPTLVYLAPGNWMKENNDEDADKDNLLLSLQDNICALINQFNPKHPVIFTTSIAKFSEFADKFRQVSLFDRRFKVIKPTMEELAKSFIEEVGADICGENIHNSLGKVGKLLDLNFDDRRRQGLIALSLRRTAKKEARQVTFDDLVNLTMRGSAESDDYATKTKEALLNIAVHEAGHATIAMIDSDGANTPEYVSIIESDGYHGMVSDSYDYHYAKNNNMTYVDFRHQIRIFLAGRAAEHLILGSENISTSSAKGDLRKSTEIVHDMFSYRGISADMESMEGASANLCYEMETNSPANLFRIESMSRSFLAKQYNIVYEMLINNRSLFDDVVEKLMERHVLDHQELIEIKKLHIGLGSLIVIS